MANKPKKIWDNAKLIDEVMKSNSTKLRIELVARDGVRYFNIREWYLKKSTQEWKPSTKGIVIPIVAPINGEKLSVAEHIVTLLHSNLGQALEFPLEDEENAVWL